MQNTSGVISRFQGYFWPLTFACLLALAGCGTGGNGPGKGQTGDGESVLAVGGAQISGFLQNTTTGVLTTATGSPFSAGSFAAKACALNTTNRLLFVAQANNSLSSYTVDTSAVPAASSSVATAGIPSGIAVGGNSFVYVTNSSTNNISGFSFTSSGAMTALTGFPFATNVAPGAVIVHPNGRFLYVGSQQAGTVQALSVDTSGGLAALVNGTITLPSGMPTGFAFSPDGNFLLVADSAKEIRSYSVGSSGLLTEIAGSPLATPVAFSTIAVTPNGRFAYAVGQGDMNVYGFTLSNGLLTAINTTAVGTQPSSVAVDPSGAFLLVANTGSSNLSVFAMDSNSGALQVTTGSPVPTVLGPVCVEVLP